MWVSSSRCCAGVVFRAATQQQQQLLLQRRSASTLLLTATQQRHDTAHRHHQRMPPPSSSSPQYQHVQRRELSSIMEKFQDNMSARADKQQLKQFKEQVKKMLEGPKYTLSTWDAEMTEAMSSWRMMMPGAKSQPEVQKMEAFRDIIKHMTEDEKADPAPLANDGPALERIAAASDRPAEDVKLLVQRFQTLVVYQDWLLQRKAEGKRMPRNMEDMQALARGDLEKKHKKKMRGRFRRF
jgi:hypothetical protein